MCFIINIVLGLIGGDEKLIKKIKCVGFSKCSIFSFRFCTYVKEFSVIVPVKYSKKNCVFIIFVCGRTICSIRWECCKTEIHFYKMCGLFQYAWKVLTLFDHQIDIISIIKKQAKSFDTSMKKVFFQLGFLKCVWWQWNWHWYLPNMYWK